MSAVDFIRPQSGSVTAKPDLALLCAVGERLTQVLASNRQLAKNPTTNLRARRRIESVIAGLIDALDRIYGDCDLEDGCDAEMVCEDEGAQCDDEGHQCSGIADAEGVEEQGFGGLAERLHFTQSAGMWAVIF